MSAFNALSYEQELQAAGVAKEQAAVHAKALGQVMAQAVFQHDLKTVESTLRKEIALSEQRLSERIDMVRETLTAKIDSVRTDLNARIEVVRGELSEKIAALGGRMATVEHDLVVLRWFFGLVITLQVGTFAAVLRMLLR